MKLLSTASTLLLLAPLPISARSSLNFFESQSPIKTEGLPVKGDNPLEYCADPSGHLLQIESVDLYPNPPLPYVFSFFFILNRSGPCDGQLFFLIELLQLDGNCVTNPLIITLF